MRFGRRDRVFLIELEIASRCLFDARASSQDAADADTMHVKMVQLRLFVIAILSVAILSGLLGSFATSALAANEQLHVSEDHVAQVDLCGKCADDRTNCPATCSLLHWLSPPTAADGAKPTLFVFGPLLDQQALSCPGELDPPPPRK